MQRIQITSWQMRYGLTPRVEYKMRHITQNGVIQFVEFFTVTSGYTTCFSSYGAPGARRDEAPLLVYAAHPNAPSVGSPCSPILSGGQIHASLWSGSIRAKSQTCFVGTLRSLRLLRSDQSHCSSIHRGAR